MISDDNDDKDNVNLM